MRTGRGDPLQFYTEFAYTEDVSNHVRDGIGLEGESRTSLAVERKESRTDGAKYGVLLLSEIRF